VGFFKLLLDGQYGKAICDLNIDERFIGEDGNDLLNILWENAETNRLRLQKSCGLPRGISREDIVRKRAE